RCVSATAVARAAAKLGAVSARLDAGMDPLDLLREVLGEFELEVLETSPIEYRCYCTRERVSRALISLGKDELASLMKEQGGAELTCQFCDKVYRFDQGDLQALLDEAVNK
ncbi:MAG: Hsp33 family molecular chaperone HslO, partial [Oscillospiraceae bacterium]|nr:Hsp33 family molecular chaperone HslO [Oscillospiraceae bacterium]